MYEWTTLCYTVHQCLDQLQNVARYEHGSVNAHIAIVQQD